MQVTIQAIEMWFLSLSKFSDNWVIMPCRWLNAAGYICCHSPGDFLGSHYILWAVCPVAFDIPGELTTSISFKSGSFQASYVLSPTNQSARHSRKTAFRPRLYSRWSCKNREVQMLWNLWWEQHQSEFLFEQDTWKLKLADGIMSQVLLNNKKKWGQEQYLVPHCEIRSQ